MSDLLDALGQAVLDYMQDARFGGSCETFQQIADRIEIVLTPEQMMGLKIGSRPGEIWLSQDGGVTFRTIPVHEVAHYSGDLIKARGYFKATRS